MAAGQLGVAFEGEGHGVLGRGVGEGDAEVFERKEDVAALAELILRTLADGVTLSQQAETVLMQHEWPENVRELRNALKRAVAVSRGARVLQATHFSPLGETAQRGGATLWPGARVGAKAGARVGGETEERVLRFPAHVRVHADRAWKEGELAGTGGSGAVGAGGATGEGGGQGSVYAQRALYRAVLLCLAQREPMEAWPKALVVQWRRLFGEKWATSEDGRGLRELVRELGLDWRDEGVRREILGNVGRVGGRG